jgi:hypothetical protein
MTVTPSLSSPNAWPLTDELADIDQKIADLQRTADQAQTSSAVAASEVAIAQKAIRDLSTAKSEILEKGKLWDRDAQLQRALAERKAVADRVKLALGARGSLAAQRKTDLETALKAKAGIAFTPDQLAWLVLVRDHIATSLSIEPDDFEYAPFSQRGGLGKAHQLFGDRLPALLEELNEKLAA